MRVLVVEDFEPTARAIVTGLRREGMAVDVAYDGADALGQLALTRYDVVVLDRDLPGVHGDEVCRQMAAGRSPSRILMLTAAGSLSDRVEGLDLGADDYLAKPFDFPELTARVRALGRRAADPLPPVLHYGDLKLDPGSRTASRAGQRLVLSAKEFALLEYLLARAGRVVSAEELLERVRDEAADPFIRLPRRSLQVRLALLYAALFCVSAVALAAVALVFRPDFLMRSSVEEAPNTPAHLVRCCRQGQSVASIAATVAHDMSQNPAGVAMVGVMVALAVGVGWLVAGRLVRPLRAITSSS